MNILYLLPSLKNAGPVNVCLNLIKELPDSVSVTVLALNDGDLRKEFEALCPVRVIKRKSFLKLLHFRMNNLFDIAHSHCTIPDIYSKLFIRSKLKVTTIHNYLDVDFIYGKGFFLGRLEGLIGRFFIKDFIKVACSKSVMKYCHDFYKMKDVVYVSNGVPEPINYQHRIDSSTYDFYYLGSLINRKNVQEILSAFIKFKGFYSGDKKPKLHIIGDGKERKFLEEKYRDADIIFYGKIRDPLSVITSFDCFLSASKAEGLPLALIESLSIGKTFLCSNIDPHKEVYLSGDSCGMLFDNEVDLIKKMNVKVLNSNDNKRYKLCHELYLKNYTSAKMASDYLAVYKKEK